MSKWFILTGFIALWTVHAQAQNLLIDAGFNVNPGSGTAGTVTEQGTSGSYQYVVTTGGVTANGGLSTNVGGAGGWSFQNGGALAGSTPQNNSAIYVVYSPTSPDGWVPPAGASNTTGYVVQLDTISTLASWKTGNAIYQTVNVTSGQAYQLSFEVNTESGAGKSNLSAADVMLTNANITNTGGSEATILTTNPTNLNALSYGDVTGYQYTANTTSQANGATAATWTTYNVDFTATSSTVQLNFADDPISTNSNIAVEDLSITAVPESRAWTWMVILGVGALIFGRKMRLRLSKPI